MTSSMAQEEKGGCLRVRMIEFHDYRTLMGPCLISFSIPLLIPGVVLTVVGSYGNEHTFATFGGWHISGIIILIIAVSMLLVGIVFKCLFRPYLSPDVLQHLTPTHSINKGHKNLGSESEKDIEKAKRVYKGLEKDDLNTQINSQLHRVVSTHEVREQVPDGAIEANGAVAQLQNDQRKNSNKHKQTNKVTPTKGSFREKNKDAIEEDIKNPDLENQDEVKEKRRRKHRSKKSAVTEETHNDGGITTTVTSSIQAEADTQVVTTSDRERNASQQDLSEKKRRRRKKKKRHRERLEREMQLSDGETRIELPDLSVETSQIPPNVPHHLPSHIETETDLNTPRPIEETQHIPIHYKTDLSKPLFNEGLEHKRLQDNFDEEYSASHSNKQSHIEQFYNQTVSDSDTNYFHEHAHRRKDKNKENLDFGADEINKESDVIRLQNRTDRNPDATHPIPMSRHAHFLKKRGIDSDSLRPIEDFSKETLHDETYPYLGSEREGGDRWNAHAHSSDHSHHVHFQNETEPRALRPRHLYSQTQLDVDLETPQPVEESDYSAVHTGHTIHDESDSSRFYYRNLDNVSPVEEIGQYRDFETNSDVEDYAK